MSVANTPLATIEQRLRRHVDVLAELIGERNTEHPDGLAAAREYLRRTLRDMGVAFQEQAFTITRDVGVNFEVLLPGSDPRLATLVVGAHYDSAPGTPGADDNASAVAILLEIVRALTSAGPPRRTVRCVFYDCEEPPHFNRDEMGSQEHAYQLRRSGEPVLGMVCLESLGYFPHKPDAGVFRPRIVRWVTRIFGTRNVIIVSNPRSIRFGLRFLWAYVRSGWFPCVPAALPVEWVPHIELSDHRAYWAEGFPALMVTDTALMRNPHYHLPTDRLATLDLPRMARLCRTLAGTILRLVGSRRPSSRH